MFFVSTVSYSIYHNFNSSLYCACYQVNPSTSTLSTFSVTGRDEEEDDL